MPYTVLIPNVISIILLLILLVNVHNVSRNTVLFDSKIFIIMVLCNIFQCAMETLSFGIEGVTLSGFYVFNLIVNCLLFIVNIIFTFLWVVYVDYKINEDFKILKKHSLILCIPAVIVIVLSLVNLFVPVFFRITNENMYERTNLFIVPYVITYFYLAYGTIYIYLNKRRSKKYIFLPAIIFMLPILIGSLIQFFFYGFSTVWTGVAIGLVSLYLNIQNDTSYIDKLSGVYTRRYMYEYLSRLTNKKDSNKKILGVLLDIDDFKNINDTYGHLVGDEAIRNAGKILYSSSSKSFVSRYGGDEFVLIRLINSEEDIQKVLESIEKAEGSFNSSSNSKYKLNFSKGYTLFDFEKDTIDTFLCRIDKAMYEAKKERKSIDK